MSAAVVDDDLAVCLFVKAPEPGRVKTRLARSVGHDAAASLYAAFALDLLDELRDAGLAPIVFYDPPDAAERVRRWLGGVEEHVAQTDGDLGARMRAAVERVLATRPEASRVLLLGSDLPDLPAAHVREAAMLLSRSDAVFGPSGDGGYWLVGFTRSGYRPGVFSGVAWSGADVLSSSLALLAREGARAALAPMWRDVDDAEDLEALKNRLSGRPGAAPRTRRLLDAWREPR